MTLNILVYNSDKTYTFHYAYIIVQFWSLIEKQVWDKCKCDAWMTWKFEGENLKSFLFLNRFCAQNAKNVWPIVVGTLNCLIFGWIVDALIFFSSSTLLSVL